jgi:hypothetical protein
MPNRTFLLTGSNVIAGVDGDLKGLVPERQALPESAHIVVDGTTVEIFQSWTSGSATITGPFVYSANTPSNAITLAGRIAQFVQDQLNPGLDDSVVFTRTPTEGVLVRINVMPGDYSANPITFNQNTFNYGLLSDVPSITWSRSWLNGSAPDTANNGRVVRDIVFIGMGARIDSVKFPRVEFRFIPDNGLFDGQVDNVRFEHMRFQNSGQRETIFGGTNMIGNMDDHPNANGAAQGQSNFISNRAPLAGDGIEWDVWRDTLNDRLFYKQSTGWEDQGTFNGRFLKDHYQGVIKIYDCQIKGEENTTDYMGCGQKQAIRMQAYCTGMDLRNVEFFAAQEHSVYMDNPQALLYMVNCFQSTEAHACPPGVFPSNGGIVGSTERLGNGNTFLQLASRLIRHPGHHPNSDARVVLLRTTMQGNLTTHGIGGYDVTIWGGFDGEVHIIDCDIVGSASPWGPENPDPGTGNPTAGPGESTSQSRGGINMNQEAGWDNDGNPSIAKGATVFETSTGSGVWYSTRKLVVSGLTMDMAGSRRSTNNLRCVNEIVYGFDSMVSSAYKAQFQMNGDQEEGGTVPYRPNLSFAWGAEMLPDPSASPPFRDGDGGGGLYGTATAKMDHRSITDSSDAGRSSNLTDAQVAAYDGSDPI